MPVNPAVRSAITLTLEDPAFQFRFTYDQWEAGFIERWGVEILENGRLATIYIEDRRLDPSWMTFHEAARAFHVNIFRFKSGAQLVAFANDYEKVIPELIEPPLDESDWRRLEQQQDAYADREKPRVFDMEGNPLSGQ